MSPQTLLKKARKLGIGLAVTDHNDIRAALQLAREDIMFIPGIEVNSKTNKDTLLYFYKINDLKEFYEKHIAAYRFSWRRLRVRKTMTEILEDAEKYNCVKSLAHPYGYLTKNIIKTLNKRSEIMRLIDSIEIVNGGNTRRRNTKAISLAQENEKAFTAGTDSHSIGEFGKIVTFSYADGVESFLDNIRQRQNFVMGKESSKLRCTFEEGMRTGMKMGYPLERAGYRTKDAIKHSIERIKPGMGGLKSRLNIRRTRNRLMRRVKL
jgi:predicted metal-dependent phosphoesterase TrpH